MDVWWKQAIQDELFPGCGPHLGGPFRIVAHRTEGDTIAGALATYKQTGNYPHFTLDNKDTHQHCALNVGATALEHPANTCQTNRQSAIQIEIVGDSAAGESKFWNDGTSERLKECVEWIATQTGVRLNNQPTFMPYPASYGLRNGVRMTEGQWLTFNGICGHQHVPNNQHGDPGLIDLSYLRSDPIGAAMARVPNAIGAAFAPGTTKGVWVVAPDGGVFTFGDAKFHGSMGGHELNAPICAIVAHGAGGYWLLGKDLGIFAFGDAPAISAGAEYPLFDGEYNRGEHAICGGYWDGNNTLICIADDGDTYALHH